MLTIILLQRKGGILSNPIVVNYPTVVNDSSENNYTETLSFLLAKVKYHIQKGSCRRDGIQLYIFIIFKILVIKGFRLGGSITQFP